MSRWQPGGPEPPRLWPLWDAVAARLRSPEMIRLLEGNADRVFAPHEDGSRLQNAKAPWSRVVVVPASPAFERVEDTGNDREVAWLVRSDVMPPEGAPFNAQRWLESLQLEAWRRLHNWTPGDMDHLVVRLPVWREVPHQGIPLWDEGSGTMFLSAQFRAIAEPLVPAE